MAKKKRIVRRTWTKDDLRLLKSMAKDKKGVAKIAKALKRTPGATAVKAAKQWRFKPGTKDGVPVRVLVSIEMSFTLRPTPPSADGK